MFHLSHLTIVLILVAACFDPVVSQIPSSAARKHTKSPSYSPPKCSKNTKSSCLKIVVEDFELLKDDKFVSYGNGRKGQGNPMDTKAIAAGTQWIQKGSVRYADAMPSAMPSMADDDYYYYIHCTVLEGKIDYDTVFDDRRVENDKVTCNLDLCLGVGYSEADVPDCVFLKGLTKFDIRIKTNNAKGFEGWYGAIIGGTGRFTGSIGLAEFIPKNSTNLIPNPIIELDASVSPYYEAERVEVNMPPVLDTSMALSF